MKRARGCWIILIAWPLLPIGVALATPGDVEPNEVVDLRDLLQIRNALGQTGSPGFIGADVDANGIVDTGDIWLWRQNFPHVGTPNAPYIAINSPVDGSLIGDRRPIIVIDYSPTSLNVVPSSVQVLVDGVDRSADAIASFRSAVLPLDVALVDGPHAVEASIEDTAGTLASTRADFTVTSLAIDPRATPRSGPAPLTVIFEPNVIWSDIPPAWYRWDWEDDGTYDIVDPRPDLRQQTFYEEGLHTVRFQVQLSDGTLADRAIDIAVTESFASVSPSNGTAPLTVFLHGIAADLSDPVVLYEWDYDFDGSFVADYTSTTDPNLARVYPIAGVYKPRFRATHLSGASVEHPIIQTEVHATGLGTPTALASAAQGANALTVNFSGAGLDDGTIDLYEWDFENDGVWDFAGPTSGQTSHVYPTAGAKVAALRVTDNDGNFSIDRVRVDTLAPASLEILDDTIDPGLAQTVTVRTTTTIASTVWLYIRDGSGRIVRTLVDHESRTANTYDDLWDGRDDRYEPVHPGAYYAVLQYSYPGRTDTLDLDETTGGNHYFAARIPPTVTVFDPLADDPLPMNFRIPSASRTSLYVLPGGTNRTATIFDSLALGAGDYTYYWAGLASDGSFAQSATYLWTVNGWTLGDNAIVVTGLPEIDNVTVTPNHLSPTDRPLGSATAEVAFDVSEPVSVFVKVISIENQNTLRTFQLVGLPTGTSSFIWDGKTADGVLVSPGFYKIALRAVDDRGNLSIERDGIMEIRY